VIAACIVWLVFEPAVSVPRTTWTYAVLVAALLLTAILFLGQDNAFMYFNF